MFSIDGAVDFKCTPKQYRMLVDLKDVDEILFGGQAGGAKSEGLLQFCLLRRLQCQGSVGIAFRRTYKDLDKSLIRKTKMPQYGINPENGQRMLLRPAWTEYGAKWNEEKKLWAFPNGSIQEFGYIDKDDDLMNYYSSEYDDLVFDELTHFEFEWYERMKARLRPRGNWKALVRSASNPGGVSHGDVKAYFVDMAREKVFSEWDKETGLEMTRYFIPASLEDNTIYATYLNDQFKRYMAELNKLPEMHRKMLRDGNWDYVPGAAFMELNRKIHSFEGDTPPKWAKILMGFDFGFGKPFSCGWYWVDYDGRLYRFAEWYGWSGKADDGVRMSPSGIAKGILEREEQWKIKNKVYQRIADPSIFSRTPNLKGGGQGESIAEMMGKVDVWFNPADNDRLLGKMQFHERLKVRADDMPMLFIGDECTHFWRTVPTLQVNENNIEDVDSDLEDHVYDEVRYVLMSRPLAPEKPKGERHKQRYVPKRKFEGASWMAK